MTHTQIQNQPQTAAILVRGLSKQYGTHSVLNGFNLCLRKGEIFALLGANGAGKTTALACIEGLRHFDHGEIAINGRIGVQLQSASLPEHIRAMEAVRLFALWNHTAPRHDLLAELGIPAFAGTEYGHLSVGQKRRLHLALALTTDPDILICDEPTAGLDIEGRAALHALIRRLKQQGKSILLSTHDMAEAEALCDRIGILTGGSLAFVGTTAALRAAIGQCWHITVCTERGTETFRTGDLCGTLLAALQKYRDGRTAVSDIRIDRGSLEEQVMQIVKGGQPPQ